MHKSVKDDKNSFHSTITLQVYIQKSRSSLFDNGNSYKLRACLMAIDLPFIVTEVQSLRRNKINGKKFK